MHAARVPAIQCLEGHHVAARGPGRELAVFVQPRLGIRSRGVVCSRVGQNALWQSAIPYPSIRCRSCPERGGRGSGLPKPVIQRGVALANILVQAVEARSWPAAQA
jgi:hypothetical protein